MVLVSLAAATICFSGACYPALVGDSTEVGEYKLQHARVISPSSEHSALLYNVVKGTPMTIHPVIYVKGQNRHNRLATGNAKARRGITGGCINVDPMVFALLSKLPPDQLVMKVQE